MPYSLSELTVKICSEDRLTLSHSISGETFFGDFKGEVNLYGSEIKFHLTFWHILFCDDNVIGHADNFSKQQPCSV